MQCHCGNNNRAPRWTFMDLCKPEVRPGAREESASPAWLAVPAMNARDTTKGYMWRLDTGCGPTLYRKCHSHNTPGKSNSWPLLPLNGFNVFYFFSITPKRIFMKSDEKKYSAYSAKFVISEWVRTGSKNRCHVHLYSGTFSTFPMQRLNGY